MSTERELGTFSDTRHPVHLQNVRDFRLARKG